MTDKPRLQTLIEDAAQTFAYEIIDLMRAATVAEMQGLRAPTAPAAPAAPAPAPPAEPAPAPEPTDVSDHPEPAPKPKKKRAWPKCSAADCDKNVYMPSGPAKLCYRHHMESGGKPSPLVKVNAAKKNK